MNEPVQTSHHRILIVEDSLSDQKIIRESFKTCGYQCSLDFAATLKEAREQLAIRVFELILLDLVLGWENGLDLVKHVRSEQRLVAIPIIVLSGLQGNAAWHAYRSGVNCFLVKDPDYAVFAAKIKSTMDFWMTVAQLPRFSC